MTAARRYKGEPNVQSTASSGTNVVVESGSTSVRALRNMLGAWARVGEGGFHRPNKQGKLDEHMEGQCMFCPSCGEQFHQGLTEGHVTCLKCKASYSISLGYNPQTGDVAVCRMDRWR